MASSNRGSLLVEILLAVALFSLIVPSLISGLITSRQGEPQQRQRQLANALINQTQESLRIIRQKGWDIFSPNGTFHPEISNNTWILASGTDTVNGFTRSVIVSNVYRDSNGNIGTSGTLDPSTKKISTTINWTEPTVSSTTTDSYFTRYLDNLAFTDTSIIDFNAGTNLGTTTTNITGGEVTLANNNKAKWCTPEFSSATIDLPDGPPVAVSATASSTSINTPNDVFVATAPTDSTSIKMAYVNVTANSDPPVPSLGGIFTLDPAKYSNSNLVPTGIGITNNNFRTNDIKYYTSPSGNLYAIIATNLPDKEVIAVQIKSGGVNSFQDSTNKIFKLWTFFNTRQYQGDVRSTPNQDQAPFNYGAINLTIFAGRGYVVSGGYMYVFDLSTIDSKNMTTGLDMIGCRIELDGYDCKPGSNLDQKYNSNETGATWSNTTPPAHLDCSDGGNIELYADRQISIALTGTSTYAYIAVGAGVNPELDIVNVTSIPTSSSSPKINNTSCGRISGGNAGWKVVGSLDLNTYSSTEEAANSVYAKSDGTRVYLTSNGGIMHNNIPDSNQLYVIDTTTKTSPQFLTKWTNTQLTPLPGHYINTAKTGYYNGDATNIQLFPRRGLTVLNGQRAIIVGQDGVADSIEPKEYQVINLENESTPTYCGGVTFLPGFNDLTSVSEADGDNFVYMVANTTEKQLKIIQGGPDSGIYVESGTFQSKIHSSSFSSAFNQFSATVTQPTNTSIKMQVAVAPLSNGSCTNANFTYVGPDSVSPLSSYFTPDANNQIKGTIPFTSISPNFLNPSYCFSYKTFLSSIDANQTPVLKDVTVNYSP